MVTLTVDGVEVNEEDVVLRDAILDQIVAILDRIN